MITGKTFFALFLTAVFFVPFAASTQITIGSGNQPSPWSLLYLDNSEQEQPKALYLPRLTTEDRRLLTESFTPDDKEEAKGLMIFRVDAVRISAAKVIGCLEFWNGESWVSLCGDMPQIRCGAYIAPNVWREFMCHNLGADESLNPFTPHSGLHGAMFKWGNKEPALAARENIDISGAVPNWQAITPPPDGVGNWDLINANPCPEGWRVPTYYEWRGVLENNPISYAGTWSNDAGNFSSGVFFGDALFLPAAGERHFSDGVLNNRGAVSAYWSSTNASATAAPMMFSWAFWYDRAMFQNLTQPPRTWGMPVRCIAKE